LIEESAKRYVVRFDNDAEEEYEYELADNGMWYEVNNSTIPVAILKIVKDW